MSSILDDLFGVDGDEDEVVIASQNYEQIAEIGPSLLTGGRGVYATVDIPIGTLVVSECPSMKWKQLVWSDSETLKALISDIIKDEKAHDTTKSLYPMTLNAINKDELQECIKLLLDEESEQEEKQLSDQEIEFLRVALVLKHNGFTSGLYRYLTMINHSCEPNCIKFPPLSSPWSHSEVWSIKKINKGDEITICYCNVNLNLDARTDFLKSHHNFSCSCARCCLEASTPEGERLSCNAIEQQIDEVIETFETSKTVHFDQRLFILDSLLKELLEIEIPLNQYHLHCVLHNSVVIVIVDYIELIETHGLKRTGLPIQNLGELLTKHSIFQYHFSEACFGANHPDMAGVNLLVADSVKSLLLNYPNSASKLSVMIPNEIYENERFTDLKRLISQHFKTGQELKKLYSTNFRYPQVSNLPKVMGSVYWNNDIN